MNLVKRKSPWFPSLVDDFFRSDWVADTPSFSTTIPAANIKETEKQFVLDLAVPGKEKKDFEISVEEGVLSVGSFEKEEKKSEEGGFTRREFSYNSFRRLFSIPESVDASKINASYSNGVLTVALPKREEAIPTPKKLIEIK